MAIQERIGMISTLVVVVGALIFSYTNYLNENQLLVQILANVAIALGIAFSIWFITTRKERKNKKYVRNHIVISYLQIISICEGLINVSDRITRIDEFLADIKSAYARIFRYVDTHSHLLDAEEIENIFDEENLIEFFVVQIRADPNNEKNIREFYTAILTLMRRYIKIHKLTDFNENEFVAPS